MTLSFDSRSVLLDGRRTFLFSGEFHYFRVPAADWRRRMDLLREAGGNAVATYVPWIVHEPEDGRIVFGDRPERDLAAFLRTAADAGLAVILRPGPYSYSELVSAGLPPWLLRDHPELRAKKPDGSDADETGATSVSYLHPVFLEKARRWYRAVAEVVRPFLASAGGPVALVQLDNELAGIHLWNGYVDANPETFGLGREDGFWPRWLARKYGSPAAMSAAYGEAFASFAAVPPIASERPGLTAGEERRRRDFFRCYLEQLHEYLRRLAAWLREDGIDAPTCHNTGSSFLTPIFPGVVRDLGPDFLLGYDHYYTLGPSFGPGHPCDRYARGAQFDVDLLRTMGMPPVGFEIQAGNITDVPPILPEDLLACYRTHLAAGAKGMNLYVFTGGPNFEDTGSTADVYDYCAPVAADGTVRPTYEAVRTFGRYVASRPDLLEADRARAVQVGYEWDELRLGSWAPPEGGGLSCAAAQKAMEEGFHAALRATRFPPAFAPLDGSLDPAVPLVLVAPAMMSEDAQRAVVSFLEKGGRLLLAPWAPELDHELRPCTVLRDFLGLPPRRRAASTLASPIEGEGLRIFQCEAPRFVPEAVPAGAVDPIVVARTGETIGWRQPAGAGEAVLFGTTFTFAFFDQARLLERALEKLGAAPVVASSNRALLVDALDGPGGRRTVFVSNLHAAPVETILTTYRDGRPCDVRTLRLAAMQVLDYDV